MRALDKRQAALPAAACSHCRAQPLHDLRWIGWLAQLSHSTIWAGSLLVTWLAIKSMDMTRFLSLLPAGVASHVDPSAGAFAIAFVLVKLTG